jgi:flavorubredoxin
MKTVIVFESMFGNTQRLAGDVRDGLVASGADVALAEVTEATAEEVAGCDLLVLAAPTHALGMSRRQTRADAVSKGADPAHATTGVREWLARLDGALPAASSRPRVAVFDTRIGKARRWGGSAAKRVERLLRDQGFTVVDRTSFFVDSTVGPLSLGEQERAREWGRALGDAVGSSLGRDRGAA